RDLAHVADGEVGVQRGLELEGPVGGGDREVHGQLGADAEPDARTERSDVLRRSEGEDHVLAVAVRAGQVPADVAQDRKSTRLNSSHVSISYAVFCLKKK